MSKSSEKVMALVETASLNTQYTKTAMTILSGVSKDLQNISDKLLKEIEDAEKQETVVKTFLVEPPLEYDPHMAFDTQSAQILYNLHGGLLTISTTGELTPGVANSWYVMEDNLTWMFNLRRGAKFQNGREITAEDVKYSFERLLSPALKSPNKWFLEEVEGAPEFSEGRAREVSGIRIIDKYRVSIKLRKPYSGFLLNLGQYICSIIPREDFEKGKFTGCGAYILEKVDKDGCEMRAFKDYFGGMPYIDRVIVSYNGANAVESLIKKGSDFITIDNKKQNEELAKNKISGIKYSSVMGTYYAGFNLRSKSLFVNDNEIRTALNHAVNKKRIIEEVLGGLGEEAKGPMPSSMIENSYLSGFDYKPTYAKEVITRKRSQIGSAKLKVLVRDESSETNFNRITQMIINDLKEVGVECSIERVSPESYLKPESINRADLFMSRWISDTGDMDNFLQPMFNPGNHTDFTGYDNTEVTDLMNRAKEIVNPKKRAQMYKDIQKMIVKDAPWIFLYHPQMGWASREGVAGVKVNPLGIVRYNEIIMERL